MTPAETIRTEFDKIKDKLIQKHDELGMRASGNWADQLEVQVEQSGSKIVARLIGERYTEQLEFGRRPGRFPPIDAIEAWISNKGIQSEISTRSLAFLIARKIAQDGTKYFQQGGTDLIDGVITDEVLQNVIDQIGVVNIDFIVKGFVENIKQLATA